MGKGAIIIALGISLLISIVILNLNANARKNTATTVAFYQDTKARVIANSGVEIYLEKMRRNKTLKGSFINNTLMDGSYDIYIYGPDTLLNIKSSARFDGVKHTSLVTASRTPVTIPTINSAIYIAAQNTSVDLSGNMEISGNDHWMNGSPNSGGTSLPGIGVDDPADSVYVMSTIKKNIAKDIVGLGGSPSIRTIPDINDWLSLTENYIFAADTVLPAGNYTTGTILGTTSNPKISYLNGDIHFSGQSSGAGIMVINGNITFTGQFEFKGIIIAYGTTSIYTKTAGNFSAIGAAIFVAKDISIDVTGSSRFYYSKEAIDNARTNLLSSRFTVLSWWE